MKLLELLSGETDERMEPFNYTTWKQIEYEDILRVIAEKLYNKRMSLKLSQKEFAKALRCDKRTYILLEAGKIDDVSIRMLIELWSRLSTVDEDFGMILLNSISDVVKENHRIINKKRWGV